MIALLAVFGGALRPSICHGSSSERAATPDQHDTAPPASAPDEPGARAQQANVVIESAIVAGRRRVASGVILQIRDGVAYIATARHVVDRGYARGMRAEQPELSSLTGLSVLTVDQVRSPATVEWLAPHGIDLAIMSAALGSSAQTARWDRDATPQVGDQVFTVGNPHGSGWTRTTGTLAQIRDRRHDTYGFQMLQTTVALQPGNSGGGLYDSEGRLIGINSMGGAFADPRFPGGLGFSTALPPLLDLAPKRFGLPARNPERDPS